MTEVRFPFLSLPNDLGVKVMKTMSLYEQTAFSFASKKSHSKIKSLRIPIAKVMIMMKGVVEIGFNTKELETVRFQLKSQESDGIMTSLHDIPVNLDVYMGFLTFPISRAFTMSNQGMSLGKWIQHLCSIFQCEDYGAVFEIGMSHLDMQTLRNMFPKLGSIRLTRFFGEGGNELCILNTQNILRAFLPVVEKVQLISVPLHENLTFQHIGLANLKVLYLSGRFNLKLDGLLSLNVEHCRIDTDQFTLRDLNRFFKLWMKGSNRKLKLFSALVKWEDNSDWNILLKGLKAEGFAEDAEVKDFTIQNSSGVIARIRSRNMGTYFPVNFAISNFKKETWTV
ncbi:hypothetical protein B9Z55_010843 [Caenorhabditis nigoni]|uniref:Uncharacterized protein n=1 Tax=Caenorhabditis nigoni TaxID=1611254 RepID=A0A2G5UHJ8_9PELO|nr:hypothetical protein B9Z55_010843 [Caenorhabditis nigoni]